MTATLTEARPTFTTWKNVTVGNLHDSRTARAKCKKHGITPTWGWQILDQMAFETTPATLALVCTTPHELQLRGECAKLEAVLVAAQAHGLSLAPPEVGPQLWLQHPDIEAYDQCGRPYLLIGMKPVRTKEGHLKIFSLEENTNRWLDALSSDGISNGWPMDARFVFVH